MKKKIILLCIATVFISCNNEDENNNGTPRPPINKNSYIQGFFALNNIHTSPTSGIIINKKDKVVDFSQTSFDQPKIYEVKDGIGLGIVISDDNEGLITRGDQKYDNLVNQIGDTSFNSKSKFGYTISPYAGVVSVIDTLRSVNITCDKQFNKNYPAGSSLNDLFSIYFEDPYPIIKNGYKSVAGINHYSVRDLPREDGYPLYVVGEKLSFVDFEKKVHIGSVWFLVLEVEPEETDEYTFSVSIYNNQEKEVKNNSSKKAIKIKGSK